jgi:hypothetical protein
MNIADLAVGTRVLMNLGEGSKDIGVFEAIYVEGEKSEKECNKFGWFQPTDEALKNEYLQTFLDQISVMVPNHLKNCFLADNTLILDLS